MKEYIVIKKWQKVGNARKTNLKLSVVPWWSNPLLLSLLCILLANVIFVCVCVAIELVLIWLRVNDRRNSIKVTWSDSIFFRLLATWECFTGKIWHANILPTDIPSNRSMELSLNPKSQTLGLSFLAPIAFYLTWLLQRKLNSFYDRMNCNF